MDDKRNCTVIIRSVNERTEALCKKLIVGQGVLDSNIVIVREVPFSASMRKSFRLGIERGMKWTLCIDADVLLGRNAIKTMIDLAEQQEDNVCEIQCLVLDKLTDTIRPAGNHLYRTALLPLVIDQIPDEGVDLRPEFYTLNRMKSLGYPWKEFKEIIGLHDYEQSYTDIFRKCYVHAHKNADAFSLMLNHWKSNVLTDRDYMVALWGFAAGLVTTEGVRVDVHKTPTHYLHFFAGPDFREKAEIAKEFVPDVDSTIANFLARGGRYFSKRYEEKKGVTMREHLQSTHRNIGSLKMIPYFFSYLLYMTGKKLLNKLGYKPDKK